MTEILLLCILGVGIGGFYAILATGILYRIADATVKTEIREGAAASRAAASSFTEKEGEPLATSEDTLLTGIGCSGASVAVVGGVVVLP